MIRHCRDVVFLILLFFGLAAAGVVSPNNFLRSQKTIRIYVDSAPGFGHQSAGISVMKRLRELGFQGEYQVIYQSVVAEKIKKIYPGFPQGIPQEIQYLSIEEYKNLQSQGKVQKLSLAVSGADDGFGEKFYEISQADTYLRLQPLGWGESAIHGKRIKVLQTLQELPLVNLQSVSIDDFIQRLKEQTDLSEEKRKFVFEFTELSKSHFSFPIYGVGVQTFSPQRMYFYAKAAKSAVQRMNSKKSVIVPVISPFNSQEMDTILKVFGKISGFEAATTTEKKHQNQMHILSPQEFSTEGSLKPGHVYFVFIGPVPQNVFNFFYEAANLPVWVAGKNAMSLAASKGKVYLNTVDDYHLPERQNLSTESSKLLNRALTAFSVGYQEFANQHHLTALSQFIQVASTPGTELEKFYSGIGTKMSTNDKVLEGLRQILGSPSLFMCSEILL